MDAMIVSTVKVNIGISWTVGDLTQNLNDLLNGVLPKFANIVTMCVLYLALGKKNVKASNLIWVLIVIVIALGALGIHK